MESLTPEQRSICDKYFYSNYISSLSSSPKKTLSRDEIMYIEKMTRGQSENELWNLLRLDRRTASGPSTQYIFSNSRAMSFGLSQEKLVKQNKILIKLIKSAIERRLNEKVTETVLDCGMFFSRLGLNSASPDAYFVMESGTLVPMEIKCPFTYENVTVEEMRNSLNVRKQRYRVACTAFSVNRTGTPIFTVEHKDPHYRQMQRQMYVLDSPICVYLVRFKDSFVAMIVDRDESFCEQEGASEQKLYDMFAYKSSVTNENNTHCYYNKFCDNIQRMNTFRHATTSFDDEDIKRLTSSGLYYSFGRLKCAFCSCKFDIDTECDNIINNHNCNISSSKDFSNDVTLQNDFKHLDFAEHSKRVESLFKVKNDYVPANLNSILAFKGLCYVEDCYMTFCCGQRVDDFNVIKHLTSCGYMKLINGNV
ncbi:alkaline exonuclease [Hemileuca sp. nucleopolyhedrovirus]|uniref:Alkaline exonuclease n=1 Tax=Hemileuca sp. nucleopolyhedrovirus TaxID=1367203 RepID=S5MK82_9ABAC|nr:alkaline exonuclease [Hemileuca sp. nucleopolyhedrovirus]AGR56876.1 alkaline exonuclease [Hemileuca sp. nucleopolyhedrovirus]